MLFESITVSEPHALYYNLHLDSCACAKSQEQASLETHYRSFMGCMWRVAASAGFPMSV